MTDDNRDPIAAAFEDYRPAPKELPSAPVVDDALDRVAGQTVELRHYQTTEHGVTQHVEHITITAPVYPKGTH